MTDIERIAAGMGPMARQRLLSFGAEPRQMGLGLDYLLPDLVTPDDMDHPIFGPHYHLTPLGLAVRSHLEKQS